MPAARISDAAVDLVAADHLSPPVDIAVTSMMHRNQIPGLSVAVVNRENLLFAAGYGYADLTSRAPATAATNYPWFSMTKVATATATLRLADEGRIDLQAPAGDYVTALRAPGHRQPTVQDLLSHTAGLANPLPIRWAHRAQDEPPNPAELLDRVMARRRAYRYPVGEVARYSNISYLALGQVIAAAAGEPFTDHLQRSVLQPLGMSSSGFRYRDDAARATGYIRAPRVVDPMLRRLLPDGIAADRRGQHLALNPFSVDGPAYGGLIGNVLDAGRFLRMHLRDGELDGMRVLAPGTARRMRVIEHPGKPFDHGLGWFRRPTAGSGDWVEHFGSGVGFWNVMRLYPNRGIGVVIMSNTTKMYDFEPLVAELVGASWT